MASLLSLALHSKLEYLTEIMRTLLSDLASHYVRKNPKLMLRRLALDGSGLGGPRESQAASWVPSHW